MQELIEIVKTIFNWISQGVQDVIALIDSIPKYINVIKSYITLMPDAILPYILVMLAAFIIISIKRLVIN